MTKTKAILASLTGTTALGSSVGIPYYYGLLDDYLPSLSTLKNIFSFANKPTEANTQPPQVPSLPTAQAQTESGSVQTNSEPNLTFWTKKIKNSTSSSTTLTKEDFEKYKKDLKCLFSGWTPTTANTECNSKK